MVEWDTRLWYVLVRLTGETSGYKRALHAVTIYIFRAAAANKFWDMDT